MYYKISVLLYVGIFIQSLLSQFFYDAVPSSEAVNKITSSVGALLTMSENSTGALNVSCIPENVPAVSPVPTALK